MDYKTYRGKMVYTHDEIGERGREWFTVTKHLNGDRTVRAMCELYDINLLRDVVYTVNSNWHPVDAFIRLTQNNEFMGSGWFHFTDNYAECETFLSDGGRLSQRIAVTQRTSTFGCHPVICDLWHCGGFNRTSGQRIQKLQNTLMSSPFTHGESGPMLSNTILQHDGKSLKEFEIEYMGTEEVTVPAGTFKTDHFRFLLGDFPPYDMWAFGEDLIPIKLRFDLTRSTYSLVEYEKWCKEK